MLDGLICGMPALFRTGSETFVPPELNSPRYRIADWSRTALRAFCAAWPSSAVPGFCAVESSSDSYFSLILPTLQPASSSASFSPSITASDCPRAVPWSGRLE